MKIQCNTNNRRRGKTMTTTYLNKTHSFILSWLGSATKSNKDGLTQISLHVDIEHIVFGLGSITKSTKCEQLNYQNYQGLERHRGFKRCPNTLGSTSGRCYFVELETQLSIEDLITNSSLPTQCIKYLTLSINHN
jgi:hypothetical protein